MSFSFVTHAQPDKKCQKVAGRSVIAVDISQTCGCLNNGLYLPNVDFNEKKTIKSMDFWGALFSIKSIYPLEAGEWTP